ncbi:MAG: hypothetical protein DRJ01_01035 [Bacteroidetes bacterium]|nr:MAG: hypothetical protein DRJ01_01035 [Bacteroidota bacterium]
MSFDLKVGFSCNNKCIHCVITDKIYCGNSTTQEIFDIIDNNVRQGEEVVITGGEPTIRNDFIDISKYIKKKINGKIILQTNGRKLSDEKLAKESLKYIDVYLIAVHSHNSIIHNMIAGHQDAYTQTINGIKNIIKYRKENTEVISQTVISKLNINGLIKTYDMIFDLGIRDMNLTFPHPNGDALKNFNAVVPKYENIKEDIHKVLKKYSRFINTEAIPLCYLHPYENKVFYSESIRINQLSEARGFDSSIEGIVQDYNSLISNEYRKPKSCTSCIYNNQCLGVWKEYYEHYKNELDLYPIRRKNEI